MSQAIERGTIKVVWSDNPEKIHSRMFNDEGAAKSFGQTKGNFLIFKLLQRKEMEEFSWELLPYGKHRFYHLILKSYLKLRPLFD